MVAVSVRDIEANNAEGFVRALADANAMSLKLSGDPRLLVARNDSTPKRKTGDRLPFVWSLG